MSLPFTVEQFLETFRAYHSAIGVAPLVLTLLAVTLVAVAHKAGSWRHRVISMLLAVLWLWSGIVYLGVFFARINPVARAFAIAFIAQAMLLTVAGWRGRLHVSPRDSGARVAGWVLIAYALVVYPLLGWIQGHGYPGGPSFGAPCPITIFTFAILLWSPNRFPLVLLGIPVLWAVTATGATLQLAMREDLALPVSALLVVFVVLRRRWASGKRYRAVLARP